MLYAHRGYHILLEKPMSVSENECKQICAAVEESGVMLAICHVMRYTPYSRKIKQLVRSGAIGRLISVQHLEPIGFWLETHVQFLCILLYSYDTSHTTGTLHIRMCVVTGRPKRPQASR